MKSDISINNFKHFKTVNCRINCRKFLLSNQMLLYISKYIRIYIKHKVQYMYLLPYSLHTVHMSIYLYLALTDIIGRYILVHSGLLDESLLVTISKLP